MEKARKKAKEFPTLLPCKVCGERVKLGKFLVDGLNFVECDNWQCDSLMVCAKGELEVIKAWNRKN